MPKTHDLDAKTHVFVDNNLIQLKYKGPAGYMHILNKIVLKIIVIHLLISHIQFINLDINK